MASPTDKSGPDKTAPSRAAAAADAPATVLVWFRNDLRVADNLALSDAVALGGSVVALFVMEEGKEAPRPRGGAQRWWLHHSLTALARKLEQRGIQLVLRHGDAASIVDDVLGETGATAVRWNRRYDPAGIRADKRVKEKLGARGIDVRSFDGHLLHEPSQVKTGKGEFYRVYTPFWRALDGAGDPREPVEAPGKAARCADHVKSDRLDDWKLLPTRPDWSGGIAEAWTPGEDGAHRRLDDFISDPFDRYDQGRDLPGRDGTSRLSPYLAFGEVTPFQIWHETKRRPQEVGSTDRTTYRKELAWREFSYHLLFHNPRLGEANYNSRFDDFPWQDSEKNFDAWTKGQTGYPMVDAGMRQLWQTGWMHNRVRMVVASFLTKHLLIHWRRGEAWFWDTLVDADPASNAAQWQWVAGSGADAAPYFRIFNPVLQGEKFDPDGTYVRTFVPELKKLDTKHIHQPWRAPDDALAKAGIELGSTYPRPIVDHDKARQRALAAYNQIKDAA
jgi:deoxyribodipyrimidine photo-lyase